MWRTFAKAIIPFAILLAVVAKLTGLPGHSGNAYLKIPRPKLTTARIDATFDYDPSITRRERKEISDALHAGRSDARRLARIIDGVVHVHVSKVSQPGHDAVGLTVPHDDYYDVVFDLATVRRNDGERGIRRLVWHELGHVVDFALLDDDQRAAFDEGVPPGYGCAGGRGGCADKAERFAETFAKWATRDLGNALYIGYNVPPPINGLNVWGDGLSDVEAP